MDKSTASTYGLIRHLNGVDRLHRHQEPSRNPQQNQHHADHRGGMQGLTQERAEWAPLVEQR